MIFHELGNMVFCAVYHGQICLAKSGIFRIAPSVFHSNFTELAVPLQQKLKIFL